MEKLNPKHTGSVLLGCAAALLMTTSLSTGNEARRDNAVRAAAVAKMQERLGTLRGTISLRDRHVRLTKDMIDRLKPPPSQSGEADGEDTSANEIDNFVTNSVSKDTGTSDIDELVRQADEILSKSTF